MVRFRDAGRRILIVTPAWVGQETLAVLECRAAADAGPRIDYVELARVLDADVTDMQYLTERASLLTRALTRAGGVVTAQVIEAFLAGRRYEHIVARADRLGLPLALLFKAARGRRDVVLVSVWVSRPRKAVFLSHLKVHSHLGAIVTYSSVQRDFAADRLGVPREKLYQCLQPVDERFWRPLDEPAGDIIVSVGAEARDYPTLVRALDGVDIAAEVAVGSSMLPPSGDADGLFGPVIREAADAGATAKIRLRQQLSHCELRRLYARARFVVVPLRDVEFDAGVTAITEAMAMGKAVVVTRTRGQVDVIRDGESGLYVPPGDPVALRAAVRYLLDNPAEAERMGRAGRAAVEARHTLDGWVAAIAEVVTGRRPAPR
jgi:glycosyltransferase involved in cell wall biosynthesis